MTPFVIPPPAGPFVPTTDGQRFPVRRIFCIGKNYADHVREMGDDPGDTPPVIFTKPADAVIVPTEAAPTVPFPSVTDNLHYEGEIVLALHRGGADIAEGDALSCVWGLGLGCDLTRRDLQHQCKEKGSPWDIAKALDHGAVMAPLRPGADDLATLAFTVQVNGERRQQGSTPQMIYTPARLIAHLSRFFELKAGDLVYTGTPDGVGPLGPHDAVAIEAPGLPPLRFTMGPR